MRTPVCALLVIAVLLAPLHAPPTASAQASLSRPAAVSAPVAMAIDRLTEISGAPPFQTTRILDRHGNLLYEIADRGRREIISLDQAPDVLIQATVATEDRNFFRHTGVDLSAIARAAWQNWQAEEVVSGASTITQQLARTLLLEAPERHELTLQRKVKEAMLAIDLEEQYSKAEILEMYLNTIYYGHQAYGVAAAAETYFRKHVSDLNLAETALLAGLPQAPVYLDPFIYPEAAIERQRVVLDLMQRQGYIDAAQKQAALALPLRFIPPQLPVLRAPHFVDFVREWLLERYGPEGMRQGLQVHTSIDLRYQQLAENIARSQVAAISGRTGASNAAVVILHPASGEVLAMVGSIDYYDAAIDGQVNLTVSRRQPGSAIKPVLYASAFDHGWTPASVIWDVPTSYPLSPGRTYTPRNITGRTYGPMRLRSTLANSLNISAVKLLADLGVDRMLNTAAGLGIRSWRQPAPHYGLALAVGGYEVTLLELTHAFATLANNGAFVPVHPISAVRDGAGRTLFQAQAPDQPQYAVSPVAAYQVTSALSDTRIRQLVFGARSALDTSQPTAVKTGTSDNWRDNLTVGYTPYMAVGVWVGNANGRPMRNALGSQTAAPIWHDIMEAVWATPSLHSSLGYVQEPLPRGFTAPPNAVTALVCDLVQFGPSCPRVYEEVFAAPTLVGAHGVRPDGVRPEDIRPTPSSGYCLPILQNRSESVDAGAGAPPGLEAELRLVAFPAAAVDRAAARRWAQNHNLALRELAECTDRTVQRAPLRQPSLAPPRQLVTIVTRRQLEGLQPGVRAVISEQAAGVNVRRRPGADQPIAGSVRPGQIMVIQNGPEMVGNVPWFQVRLLERSLTGWVSGQLLRGLPPEEGGLLFTGDLLRHGEPARLKPGVVTVAMRLNPGKTNPIVAEIAAGHVVLVTSGPEIIDDVPWYSVEDIDLRVQGWVDGRYFTSQQAES